MLLVQEVATLRTRPLLQAQNIFTKKRIGRPPLASRPVFDFTLKLLTHVDYHLIEKTGLKIDFKRADTISIGYSYAIVLEKLLARFPNAKTSTAKLRGIVSQMRAGEIKFDGKLPDKRPRMERTQNK